MTLLVIGLNHHSAPLDVREKVALPEDAVACALADLRRNTGLEQSVIVSTCNRLEIYAATDGRYRAGSVAAWLCGYHGLGARELDGHLFTLRGASAVRHLLRVASGLDSAIVGEPQVLGQVKTAYRAAFGEDAGDAGSGALGRLFEHALKTAKQARSETGLGRHPISYASIAVDVCKKIFEDLSTKHALMIGAGEMIELTIRHFKSGGVGALAIANRSPEKARALAAAHGADAVPFAALGDALPRYDVIVSGTSSKGAVVGKAMIERALKERKRRPVYIVDIALPRDVEPAVAELEDVYLYTLDNLVDIADVNQRNRLREADKAERIVERRVAEFVKWLDARQANELIRQFRARAESHRDDALDKAAQLLRQGKSADEALRRLAHALTAKLVHQPTAAIQEAAENDDKALLDGARKLFGLDGNDDER